MVTTTSTTSTTDLTRQIVQQFYNDTFTKHERRTWIYSWFISGTMTILIPLVIFITSRQVNTNNDDDNGDNNGEDNNNNNNNNNQENQVTSPWWFFGGGNNDDRRDEERTPPILIATYLWSILVFNGILFLGYRSLKTGSTGGGGGGDYYNNNNNPHHHDNHNNPYDNIIVALILFANYNVLSLLLLSNSEGAIETDGRGVEEHGFVGQFGVMMYITSLLWVIFSIVFGILLHRKGKHQNVIKIGIDQSDYESQASVASDYHEMKNNNNNNDKKKNEQPSLTTV